MRILFLNPQVEIGGGERSLLELVASLDHDAFEPLASCVMEGPLPAALREAGVKVSINPWPAFALRIGRGPAAGKMMLPLVPFALVPHLARMADLVRREKIDIIHTNGLKSHLVGSIARLMTGRRLVWHVRDVIRPGPTRTLYGWIARLTATRVVANSRAVAETLPGLPPSRLLVIYNGIDTGRFKPQPHSSGVRRSLGLADDDFVVGAIGALAPLKGHLHLIRAVPRIVAACAKARVVLVGQEMYLTAGHAGYRGVLEEEARRLGVTGRVVFAGFRDDTVDVLNAFDLLVHASIYPESFGRVIVEAMACGVPVVATALGGPTEIIVAEDQGMLIPSEDPGAIASAVIRIHKDPDLRERLKRGGRERAVAAFGIARYVREVESLYRTLTPSPSPSS